MDLSSVYLDILKDRLYTFRADSPLRRGSQTVLYEILVAMTKLMAPVLSFTAEEIWRTLATQQGSRVGVSSVHLSTFPEAQPQWQDAALAERWERLLGYRTQVQGVLEEVGVIKRSDHRWRRRWNFGPMLTPTSFFSPIRRT